MSALMNIFRSISRIMHMIAGLMLVIMMMTVLIDVIARSVFGSSGGSIDFTFRGAVEIVSYGLLFMVLFSLPYSVSRGQVIVDLFTERMSDRLKGVLAGVYTLGFGLLGFGMSYQFYESMGRVALSGETSQDLLIPLTYIYGISSFATAILAVRGLLVCYRQISESVRLTS